MASEDAMSRIRRQGLESGVGEPPWVAEPPRTAEGVAGCASAIFDVARIRGENHEAAWIEVFETLLADGAIEIPERG